MNKKRPHKYLNAKAQLFLKNFFYSSAKTVHWKLCDKFYLEKSEKCYLRNPQSVTENVKHKLIWDMNGKETRYCYCHKMGKIGIIIDVAIQENKRIIEKKIRKKIGKYKNLK